MASAAPWPSVRCTTLGKGFAPPASGTVWLQVMLAVRLTWPLYQGGLTTAQAATASINGVKETDPDRILAPADFLHGRVVLLRRGRKSLAAGRITTA